MKAATELTKALDAVNVGAVARLLGSGPNELFQEPCLRHRINAHPHNRGTAHAVALENLFSTKHDFDQSAAICRLLLERRTPVTLAHDANQVSPVDTYATLLFVQQTWPEARVSELDDLFDQYVAGGYIEVDQRFPRNHAAFGLHVPLEAAIEQGNFSAIRALFRARCSSEGLGTRFNKQLQADDYVRRALGDEKRVAQFLSAMMQGRMQANAADLEPTAKRRTAASTTAATPESTPAPFPARPLPASGRRRLGV
jgi:hypothetical protein